MPLNYELIVRHDGLHKYRVVRARTDWEVRAKAQTQLAEWEAAWARKQAVAASRSQKEQEREHKESRKAEAEQITLEARKLRATLEGLLTRSLEKPIVFDWDRLLDTRAFCEPEPVKPSVPAKPAKPELRLPERQRTNLGLFNKFIESMWPPLKDSRLAKEDENHKASVREAKHAYNVALDQYTEAARSYNAEVLRIHARWQEEVAAWRRRKADFLARQEKNNEDVKTLKSRYFAKHPEAVSDYCELVLQKAAYPDFFSGDFDLEFNGDNGILVLDFDLPIPENMPWIKSARYVPSRDVVQITEYPPAEKRGIYDDLVYQTALRTIHELYNSDTVQALQSVVFNGRTHSIDAGTGKEAHGCILSVQTTRETFAQFDLSKVDAGKCIRKLRGVAATTLYDLTPVAPVMSINRADARFIESKKVITNISGGDNLASMDWEQFEHLIREIFEKEFAANGGEVRVTRASRDGGVDAVIFDPDPIRGGKYVVQAKRYTQLVPVSAVRDLYGTVVNEGAVKGILVTTAYYGPDSYAFAKDKPLTLLDGSNLLSMLQKHGVQAHIDILAARRILEGLGR